MGKLRIVIADDNERTAGACLDAIISVGHNAERWWVLQGAEEDGCQMQQELRAWRWRLDWICFCRERMVMTVMDRDQACQFTDEEDSRAFIMY